MKAPDKIYIQNYGSDNFNDFGAYYELEDGTVLDAEFHLKTQKHESIIANIEYLRKAALLEWAKRLKEKWEEPPMSKHSPGCVYMLEQLINKLNSM